MWHAKAVAQLVVPSKAVDILSKTLAIFGAYGLFVGVTVDGFSAL
jgi:hypothetical protein